jgi:hypothetical protein
VGVGGGGGPTEGMHDAHAHIAMLYTGFPKMLVLEYCANGCLLDVLKKRGQNEPVFGDKFELAVLMGILHGIASGMAYVVRMTCFFFVYISTLPFRSFVHMIFLFAWVLFVCLSGFVAHPVSRVLFCLETRILSWF